MAEQSRVFRAEKLHPQTKRMRNEEEEARKREHPARQVKGKEEEDKASNAQKKQNNRRIEVHLRKSWKEAGKRSWNDGTESGRGMI